LIGNGTSYVPIPAFDNYVNMIFCFCLILIDNGTGYVPIPAFDSHVNMIFWFCEIDASSNRIVYVDRIVVYAACTGKPF
jgi:hypothetical protein